MSKKVIIVSSSYGSDYIKKIGGQFHLIPIIKAAGAEGIEIRRELLSEAELMLLPKLAQQIAEHHLVCYYSVPFHLFINNGELNPNLPMYLLEAKQLNAKLVKFSLGYFNDKKQLSKLKDLLQATDIQLVVENDQTECGIIEPFESFFKQIKLLSIPIKMTFDTGNWLCLDIDPQEAAKRLGQDVGYIHVKAAKLITKGKITALPPVENDYWMQLIEQHLPITAARGIEFALIGDNLESVSKKYTKLLSE